MKKRVKKRKCPQKLDVESEDELPAAADSEDELEGEQEELLE